MFEKRTSMFTVLDTNLWVWPTIWIENRDLTFKLKDELAKALYFILGP